MESGTTFFRSRLARRFVVLFLLCAFLPTVALIVISYKQVVNQLEEQSYARLKREAKAYSISLFDRTVRIDNELQSLGRQISPFQYDFSQVSKKFSGVFEELFYSVSIYSERQPVQHIFGESESTIMDNIISQNLSQSRPFIIIRNHEDTIAHFFFGVNINRSGVLPFTIIAEAKPDYLWGIGSSPILPPMTDLIVYDEKGQNIIASRKGLPELDSITMKSQRTNDLRVFSYEQDGKTYHVGTSTLFVGSRFQEGNWTIFLTTARDDVMSSMNDFKSTFPFIILLLLLLICYLSLVFIRKTLEPLELLKKGTGRVATQDFTTTVDITSNDEFEDLGRSFNDMTSKLHNHFQAQNVLSEIDRAILSTLNLKETVKTTLQRLKTFFTCDLALYVRVAESFTAHAKVYVLQGRRASDPQIKYLPLPDGDSDKLFPVEEHIVFTSHETTPHIIRTINEEYSNLCFLCLPLEVEKKRNRALLLGRNCERLFSSDEILQARKIVNQLSIALANGILLENHEKLAKGTIEALARTVDAKSKWTAGHSERVAKLGGDIGKAMDLPAEDVERLVRGGLLHDIGKIGISLSILDKPERLNDMEYAEIQTHPEIGAKILEPIAAYQDIIPIIIQHHERYDGLGYPEGLIGEEIDLRARIMSVADVWDALVSDRPYREGWIAERAKKLLIDGMGKQFDPAVVTAFLALINEEI